MASDKKVAILLTGDSSGAVKSIKLTAEELDQLKRKSKEAESSFGDMAKSAASSLGSIATTVAKWGAVAGAAAVGGVGLLVKSSIDLADQTGILAGKLGISTEALSKLQYAAKLSDVSQASLETGMKRLTRTLTDAAAGTGDAAKAFEALGLSAQQIIELPADQQLGKIADALNQVENTSQKAAIAQQIFGRGAVDMLPLLAEGSAGIAKMGDELERFGGVISGDMAQKAMQFNDNLDRLKVATTGFGLALADDALPYLEGFTNQIVALAQNEQAMEGIAEAVAGIGEAAKITAQIVVGLGRDLNDLFTRDLSEVTAEILEVRQTLDAMDKLVSRGGSIDQSDRQRWQDRLDALMKERDAIKQVAIEQKFANVEAGKSTTVTKESTDAKRDAVTVTNALAGATKTLSQAEKDRREDDMFAIMRKRESDLGLYETKKAVESTTTAIIAQKAEADPWADAMTGAVERIDAAFADAWLNIGDGFDSFADDLKSAFEQLLAELAHAAITKPIVVQLGAALGLGGATSSAMDGASMLSKIPGLNKLFPGGSVLKGFEAIGQRAGILSPGTTPGSAMTFNIGAAGLNLGAGLAGNYLGNALFGSRESATGMGSTVGAIGAQFIPGLQGPLGAFVGSAVGAAIDNLLGESDFSGKRVKLGVLTGSGAAGQENARTLSSGLQIGNITRRAGDAGMSDEAINAYLGAFDTLDSALTAIARGAGASVDFSGVTLAGQRQPYDGGMTPEGFFGSMAKGELRGTLQDAPAEFVRQWLAEIDDQLSQRVRGILGDTAGKTAEELIGLFGFAADIDKLLNIDVLKDTAKAAESASRTILDLYGEATEQVVTLAQGFDGTTESMATLTQALGTQKTIAMQLAQQYAALSDSVNATFGDAITSISESLLTEEELYSKRREQIASLTAELATTIDPAKIASITSQIDTLAKGAWSLLDDTQQQSLGAEFIAFLEQARSLAQGQITAGRDSLGSREDAVQGALDLELLNSSANTQQAAANTMQQATQQFAQWVANLPSSINVTFSAPEVNV